jgi:Reverse transcriptase (RNA-dependent DNA polymerase)
MLRVLGCLCFPYTRPYNQHKLQLHSQPCVLIGYGLSQKGYCCLSLFTNKFFVFRNIQFDETKLSFKTNPSLSALLPSEPLSTVPLNLLPSPLISQPTSPNLILRLGLDLSHPISTTHQSFSWPDNLACLSPTHQSFSRATASPDPLPLIPPSNGHEDSNLPSIIHPANLVPSHPLPQNSHPMVTRSKDSSLKLKSFPDFVAHHASLEIDPTSFNQATYSLHWREAMSHELNALANNKTWTLAPHPSNQRIIGCKWVYKTKRNPDGSVERYKAHLITKGYNHEIGIDYVDTYSPVIRATTIRAILSLVVSSNWPIKQFDITNTFLNGDLNEQVYMHQPQGFINFSHSDYVCLLYKSLYDLKQAPQAWFQKLSDSLLQLGFKSSSYDPSLFLSHFHGHVTLILVYVDDILVIGSSTASVHECIAQLS